ncbi:MULTISPECIES: hypothetical protein [Pseudovibrio]|uniref:hypothetical protein n=1 Tax=Stappiaceae TaxID=2821832 RepID=UPI002366A8A5|nr:MULTISPECIES: hypothetical protein [Pseudovibrio]MDD7911271.1 hypothetical protein [Pseudovibrio exalbescens]MDX5593042.1 hypothetical protein [Pseudovibrio sp. SPO723]
MSVNPTPISVISMDNLLFGTIRLTGTGYEAQQFPSLYFMADNNRFVRLRPFHRSGFCIVDRPSRFIFIEASYGNPKTAVYQCELGDTKAGIQATLEALPVTQVQAKPQNPSGLNLYYVTDGAFNGTMWFTSPTTQNTLCPVVVRDFTDRTRAPHLGHSLISKNALINFYNDNYPGYLNKLLALGTKAQSVTVQMADQTQQTFNISSNLSYFPEDSFVDANAQFQFISAFINGLST